jgi:hypothetical protein
MNRGAVSSFDTHLSYQRIQGGFRTALCSLSEEAKQPHSLGTTGYPVAPFLQTVRADLANAVLLLVVHHRGD